MLDTSFLGRGWKFPLEFEKGCVAMSEAEEDIDESLRILLGTYPGERLMRPTFGCRLRDYCFGDYGENTLTRLKDEIRRAVSTFEARIEIENIDTRMNLTEEVLEINIAYRVNATNSRRNLVYPFYINEGTDVSI